MKRSNLLVAVVMLVLITVSCSLDGGRTGEEDSPAAPASFQFDNLGPQIASLDVLDSYRAHRTVWLVKENCSEEINTVVAECIRKPQAIHVTYHDPETGFEEQVGLGDTIWDKKAPDRWEKTISDHRVNEAIAAAETFWGFTISEIEAPLCSDCTSLVDEETVNGIHCKHYVVSRDVPPLHVEAWVADQSDLPPLLVRGLRQEKERNMTVYTEVNLTDINKPFTVEPPE